VTDQENPNPASSGRRSKTKQIDLHVIKARVTTAERDQISVMLEARKMTMSDLIRAGVLGTRTEALEERPAATVSDLDVRIKKLEMIASMLSDVASALSTSKIVTPDTRVTSVSAAIDAPSGFPLQVSGDRRIAGSRSASGVIPAIRAFVVCLTRGEQIAVVTASLLFIFFIGTKFLNWHSMT